MSRTTNSNTVIGTLAFDGWAATFGTARTGLGGLHYCQRTMDQHRAWNTALLFLSYFYADDVMGVAYFKKTYAKRRKQQAN